jgi:hypothetical protein
MAFNNLKAELD